MVKRPIGALLALGAAGLAYLLKNKQQVKNSVRDLSERAGSMRRGNSSQTDSTREISSSGTWSDTRNV